MSNDSWQANYDLASRQQGAGFRYLRWAREVRISGSGRGTAKSVLLMLASHTDNNGVAWPSQSTLARECEVSGETVRSAIMKLEREGFIRVEHGRRSGQRRIVNRYHLLIDRESF